MNKTLLCVGVLLLSQGLCAQDLKQGTLSNVKRLTTGTERFENPRWSPDGSMIAFTNFGYDGLYVMNSDGTSKSKISERCGIGYMYQWSADCEQILVRDTRWEGGETGAGDRQAVKGAAAGDPSYYERKYEDHYAGLYPFTEGTAHHAGSSHGSLF